MQMPPPKIQYSRESGKKAEEREVSSLNEKHTGKCTQKDQLEKRNTQKCEGNV